jgi:hypothetical protein
MDFLGFMIRRIGLRRPKWPLFQPRLFQIGDDNGHRLIRMDIGPRYPEHVLPCDAIDKRRIFLRVIETETVVFDLREK